MNAAQITAPPLERVAALLEEAARELRTLGRSSGNGLATLHNDEAECPSPTGSTMDPSPTATTLMTGTEVCAHLRIDARTLRRWRSDPSKNFPQAVRRARPLRWRRITIERWLTARAS